MRLLYFVGLGNVQMISHFDPVLDFVLHDFFLLFVSYFLELLESQDRVFLLENGIGWRVEAI